MNDQSSPVSGPSKELVVWLKENVPLYFNYGGEPVSYTWNPHALAADMLAYAPLPAGVAQCLDLPNILSVIDPFTRGAFTGWEGETGKSKITLDQAEDHFSLCMADMMDAVRAALGQGPNTSTIRQMNEDSK